MCMQVMPFIRPPMVSHCSADQQVAVVHAAKTCCSSPTNARNKTLSNGNNAGYKIL